MNLTLTLTLNPSQSTARRLSRDRRRDRSRDRTLRHTRSHPLQPQRPRASRRYPPLVVDCEIESCRYNKSKTGEWDERKEMEDAYVFACKG